MRSSFFLIPWLSRFRGLRKWLTAIACVLLSLSATQVFAGPTLKKSDLVVVYWQTDTLDTCQLLALAPIPANSVIFFTDAQWLQNGDIGSGNQGNTEMYCKWTTPASVIPAGTLITFTFPVAPGPYTATQGTIVPLTGFTAQEPLTIAGEQCAIFQTVDDNMTYSLSNIKRLSATGTAEQGPIYSFSIDGGATQFSTSVNGWGTVGNPSTSNGISTSGSFTPPNSVVFDNTTDANRIATNAFGLGGFTVPSSASDWDNIRYIGPVTAADKDAWLIRVHTVSNWEGSETVPFSTAGPLDGQTSAPVGNATAPTVATTTQSNVTHNSATLGGNVTADGGATVTERGIVWGASANPTTSNNKVSNGSGTGSFSGTVTGLPSSSTVHVRAYAINTSGTGYGDDISFSTSAPPAPEIVVEQPAGTNIADAGSKSFGSVNVGGNTSLTFTIKNTGNADLTGLSITKDGTNASEFSVTGNPTAPVSGPSGTTTFTVQFAPTGGGTRTAAIHIASNDADENPFDITLTGTGVLSNNADLSNLVLSSGSLNPSFASGTTSYDAAVANGTASITVTPTVAQANATVTVNGTSVTSGSASGSIPLNVGSNTITTVVTAQDGTTTRTYTITLTRAAPVASAIVVTTDSDVVNAGDGVTSLREAILAANAQAGADVINFDATVFAAPGPYTIQLDSALPDLNGDVTINGPGANVLAVNGEAQSGDNYRIFTVPAGKTVSISGLTISNGKAAGANGGSASAGQGGAILNAGSLTVTECSFSGNTAQGGSGITTGQVGAKGQGGAIFSTGALIVRRCAFTGNMAMGGGGGNGAHINNAGSGPFEPGGNAADGQGGAIFADASSGITITNSTFYGNSANGGAGGNSGFSNNPVYNVGTPGAGGTGTGGGVYSAQALSMISCTVAGNSATGGSSGWNNAFINTGTAGSGHGGGIFSGGTVTSGNNLVAGNSANAGSAGNTPGTATGPDVKGTFSSQNFNLIGALTADASGFTGAADQKGSEASPIDAKLDSQGAQNNGGPTKTIRLRKGSPAVDKGKDLGLTGLDQRGFLRPKDLADIHYANAAGGDGSDIGAFESLALPDDVPTVQTPQTISGAVGSALSNQKVTGQDGDNDPLTFSIVSGTMPDGLTFNSDGTITGTPTAPGQSSVTFKANDTLEDSNEATLNINIVEASSTVVTTDIDNSTNTDGLTSLREAITTAASDGQPTPVTFDATFFSTAKVITLASPIYLSNDVDINGPAAGVEISGGHAGSLLGTVYFGTFNFRDLTFTDGAVGAYQSGGVVALQDLGFGSPPAVNFIGCTFAGNTANDGHGGVISNAGGNVSLVNCTLADNHANDTGSAFALGGAIYQSSGTVTIQNCTLTANTSTGGRGGAVATDGGTVNLGNSIVHGNTAATGADLSGTITSEGYNIIGVVAGATINGSSTGNQTGVDPMLDTSLTNNGGPTPTVKLLSNSPAIDKGKALGGVTKDQRGQTRPFDSGAIPNAGGGDGSDIGAYEEQTIATPFPEIVVEQPTGTNLTDGVSSIGFGGQAVGSTSTALTFTIRNAGSADLVISDISKNGANGLDFDVSGPALTTIAPAGSTTFTVTFSPISAGARNAAIHINCNDADEASFDIALTGTGTVSSNANLSGLALSSGTLAPAFATGTTSYTATVPNAVASVTLTATVEQANASLTINGGAAISGNPSGSLPLNIGANTITTVVTAQDGVTSKTYTVVVTRTAPPAPEIAVEQPALTDLTDALSSINFGTQDVSISAAPLTFTVRNSGTEALIISGINIDGAAAADFTASAPGLTTVPAAGSTTFTVTYKPTGTGVRNAALHLLSNDGDEASFDIGLTGVGTVSNNADLASLVLSDGVLSPGFDPGLLNYTSTVPNATATLTLTATAAHPASLIKVNGGPATSGTPTGAMDLKVGTNLITVVVTSQSGTVSKTYTLTMIRAGSDSGEIEIEQPAGTTLASGTSAIGYGDTALGDTATKTFIIKNLAASTLTVSSVSVSGGNAGDFVVDTSGLAPSLTSNGSQTTFTVGFRPTALGVRTTTLKVINSDADEGSFAITLSGTGSNGGSGIFSLSSENYTVLEETGTVNITILRNGSTTGPASVRLSTIDDTAKAPTDFTALTNFDVNFADGQASQTVPITVIADALNIELNEVFNVRLSAPSVGASLGAISTAAVKIVEPDTVLPTVTIVSPAFGASVEEGPVKISGGAKDNKGVFKVEISLNGAPYVDATLLVPDTGTSNGQIANYEASISPVGGTNTLTARSYDFRGNISNVVTRTFKYVVLRPLAINVTPAAGGSVTVTPALVGGQAELGVEYTLKATAASGYFWSAWTAPGVTSPATEATSLTVTMTDGLTVDAAFVSNLFVPGGYNGLASAAAGTSPSADNFGYFSGTLTATGSFSGKVNFAGTTLTFTAVFDKVTGAATGTNGTTLSYNLLLDLSGGTEKITGTVTQTATGDVSNVTAALNPYSLTNKIDDRYLKDGDNTKSGVYTVVFPALASQAGLTASDYPQGDGYGTVTATAQGVVSIAGVLADGTTVTANAPLWRDYQWPLAIIVKATAAASGTTLGGMVQFDTTQPDTDASATTMKWYKTARAGATYYPNGWPSGIDTALIGAKYNAPSGTAALPGLAAPNTSGNATLEICDGLLTSAITKWLNISSTSAVTKIPATDTTYTLTLTPTTGTLGGNFLHTGSPTVKPVLKGLILQKGENAGGYGFFLSPGATSGAPGESGGFTLSAQ